MDPKKAVLFLLLACFISSSVLAEDAPQLKLKSRSTATVLSYIPINSPAIFYVKRPVRGIIYSILETAGLTGVGVGAYYLTQVGKSPRSFLSDLSDTIIKGTGITLVAVGGAMWMAPWIHTVIATPDYVDDCNQKIKEKAGIVSFYPLLTGDGKENLYGVGLTYRY